MLTEKCCTNCGTELGEPSYIETRIIEDIQEPREVKTVKFKIGHYKCNDCSKKIVAKHEAPRRK